MQNYLVTPGNYCIRNKVRGSKRKMRSLGSRMDSILAGIPDESFVHDKVLQYRLPSPVRLVDSTNSPYRLRKRFLKLLIDHLLKLDSLIGGKYRTLLSISLPFLSHSRIDICMDDKHFAQLISNPESTPVRPGRDIVKEMNFSLPKEYRVTGHLHVSSDPDRASTEEHWIIWKDR